MSLEVPSALKIHAFGFVEHTKCFHVTSGEVSGFIPEGFVMNLLSAGGFSGAAIVCDGYVTAIGYPGVWMQAKTRIPNTKRTVIDLTELS